VFLIHGLPSIGQTFEKQVLLLGTFHFNNPGLDVVKTTTFDVMNATVQQEIAVISNKIALFSPDKIFVEWPADEQERLDSLYQFYLNGKYEEYISKRYTKISKLNFYRQNEIFQLAFRIGKIKGLKRIYAFDYTKTEFPFDSVTAAMKKAGQTKIMADIDNDFKLWGEKENKNRETMTLTEMLMEVNSITNLWKDKAWYIQRMNRAGELNDYAGPFLVAEWYRRNLYMYSTIQKQLGSSDQRIMVLAGSGHAAMLKEFIELDGALKFVDVNHVIGN
jgi:hypothetical protein